MKTNNKHDSRYARSLIEASLDPLVTISADGKITDFNQAILRITGVLKEELIGTYFSDYFTDSDEARKAYLIVFEKGYVSNYPLTIKHKNGTNTKVNYSASVYKDLKGNIMGVFATARDVTESDLVKELQAANKVLISQKEEKERRDAELSIALNVIDNYKYVLNEFSIVAITDLKGVITYANDNFCKISKYRREELIGKDHRIVNSGHHSKKFIKNLWTTIVSGKVWKGEIKNKAKDGSFYWVETAIIPFLNEKNKPYQYTVIRNDITYQKEIQERLVFENTEKEKRADELSVANKELLFQSEEKAKRASELVIADIELDIQKEEKQKRKAINKELKHASQYSRSLIEASRDPLITINTEGEITDMNEAWAKIAEKSRDQIKGTNFIDYFTDSNKARIGFNEVFSKGYVANFPLTILDGKLINVIFNGSVYRDEDGKVIGAVVVARDITEQKRNEKELLEAKESAELAALKAEESTRIAENAVKSKQQFLSNMSHEIRTPMNAIIGFTKVVLKTDLSTKQKEYLQAIKLSGNALIVLINDILDLAKVDAGKMEFEKLPFRLSSSIEAMLHIFEIKIQEKNLLLIKEYDQRIPDVLLGDSVRLHQVILNLISNAVKFTKEGEITVSVKLLEEDDEKVSVEFAVSDTGIGIPKDKIESIFNNFEQASSNTSSLYGGTGLGLAIVKQLLKPQGGNIAVKSTLGEGTVFSFVLRFDKTNEKIKLETEAIQLDKNLKKIKVLVVEDIPLNQLLMKTLLDDFGFERDIASNGKIAIEKLQFKSYDIILMDLQMPEMNGFETTTYVRNILNSKIPIIALTADVTTADLEKCTAVGMNDYIAKPVDEKVLYSKIVNLVAKPIPVKTKVIETPVKNKCINLTYLNQRTKSNPDLMVEMITLYIDQTVQLVEIMKKSLEEKDWSQLGAAVHKMIPSFLIVGIHSDYELMAKKTQEYANAQQEGEDLNKMVLELEKICNKACQELKLELIKIKKKQNGK